MLPPNNQCGIYNPYPQIRSATTNARNKVTPQEMTKRWVRGAPQNSDYYWDEDLPDRRLDKNHDADKDLWPPKNMDLSSAWAAWIIKSNLTGLERQQRWPIVFGSYYLNNSWVQKGRASKVFRRSGDTILDLDDTNSMVRKESTSPFRA